MLIDFFLSALVEHEKLADCGGVVGEQENAEQRARFKGLRFS